MEVGSRGERERKSASEKGKSPGQGRGRCDKQGEREGSVSSFPICPHWLPEFP